jgi:hypothetical protein
MTLSGIELVHFESNIIKYDCGDEANDIATDSEIVLHVTPMCMCGLSVYYVHNI